MSFISNFTRISKHRLSVGRWIQLVVHSICFEGTMKTFRLKSIKKESKKMIRAHRDRDKATPQLKRWSNYPVPTTIKVYSYNHSVQFKSESLKPCDLISPMGFTKLFLFFLLLVSNPYQSYAAENVSVTLYYETLCPYCADFIVNHLAKIFQNGLISIVNLRMVPWGNAGLNSDGSFACQHGTDECLLNTIEACTITIYPKVNRHFTFIYCVERLTLQNKHSKWGDCFEMSKLGTVPIDCYNSGYGNQIETKYAKETAQLNPPHRFVPWLVVNNKPLAEDYGNFMAYICKGYKGKSPEACRSIRYKTESIGNEKSIPQVCLAEQGRNSTN